MLAACDDKDRTVQLAQHNPGEDHSALVFAAPFVPNNKRQLLFIGQDRNSIDGYVDSGQFPAPGGVTAYIAPLYEIRNPEKSYAGIGLDNELKPTKGGADWGGGPANAWTLAKDYPNAALAIGLDINESFQENGLKKIAAGQYDREIDKLAHFVRMVDSPVFLRIGYEFDGVWNKGYENSAAYVAAWRHIVDRIRSKLTDVTEQNVAFVWQGSASPADDAIEGAFESDIGRWYPGDDYVDWVGLSWFLLIDESGQHPSIAKDQMATQRQLADQILDFSRARGKPVFLAESAPQGYDLKQQFNANINTMIDGPPAQNEIAIDADAIWQQWFAPFFEYIQHNSDAIRAVAYINCHWDSQPMWGPPYKNGFWGDTRIETNKTISQHWQKELQNPYWVHGLEQSTKKPTGMK